MLSSLFLEHVIFAFSQTPIIRGDSRKGENSSHFVDGQIEEDILQAAIFALTAFFRSISSSVYQFLHYNTVGQFCNVDVVAEEVLIKKMLWQRWW